MNWMRVIIWWIRRDLRLSDNQALSTALNQADVLIPLFILDPHLLSSSSVGQHRLAFLFDGLRALNYELRKRGSALVIRRGDPVEVLHQLYSETRPQRIVAEADISFYARRRDGRVLADLPLMLTPGLTVHPSEDLLKSNGNPYTIFSPFCRKWQSLPIRQKPLPAPEHLPPIPPIPTLGLPASPAQPADSPFISGEVEAQKRLNMFIDTHLSLYAEDRDRLDLESTSRLSPYLRFGMLSARQANWAVQQAYQKAQGAKAQQSAEAWMNELIWREFFITVLYHFPFVRQIAFRPEMRAIQWVRDASRLADWQQGHTGFPIVDAAMRQLNAIGWMSNRARMIAASFLTKDLLIDWRKGERYFMQHLIDGDPAANNGGWQWVAGTGTDAVPYFRVFNPVLQGKKFDPLGNFVKRWLPELCTVPEQYIHHPWTMPKKIQAKVGCQIGKDYPPPVVDHVLARQRALEVYRTRNN
jgi:deoxyribodipyrimidine photo-lyase